MKYREAVDALVAAGGQVVWERTSKAGYADAKVDCAGRLFRIAEADDAQLSKIVETALHRLGVESVRSSRKKRRSAVSAAAQRERQAHERAIAKILADKEAVEAERVHERDLRKFEERVQQSETMRRRWERLMQEIPAAGEHKIQHARHRA